MQQVLRTAKTTYSVAFQNARSLKGRGLRANSSGIQALNHYKFF